MLTETASHLAEAGGKRFRPLLALLAAQLGDPAAPGVVDAAVVVELTHLASLYHDDVMDEADVRRGAPSANTRWTQHRRDPHRRLPVRPGVRPDGRPRHRGDRTCSRAPSPASSRARSPRRPDPPTARTRSSTTCEVLADKTGALISTSARLGAMMAGAPAADVDTVTRFGEVIGLAFQLSDDLIDVLQRDGGVGQDPGHRPARGHPDAAGAAGAGRRRRLATDERRGCARCSPATSTTTSGWPRRCGCCARTRRWTRPRPTCAAASSEARAIVGRACRPGRRATRWRRSPTSCWRAAAEPVEPVRPGGARPRPGTALVADRRQRRPGLLRGRGDGRLAVDTARRARCRTPATTATVDVLVVSGTVTDKLAPLVRRLHDACAADR